MKNYFDFKLKGSTIFPYFIWIYLAYTLLMICNVKSQVAMAANPATLPTEYFMYWGAYAIYIIVTFLLMFFIYRAAIRALSYKGEAMMFDGDYKKYIKVYVVGALLTILTLGVYFCWLTRNIGRFYAGNTSYNNRKFRFDGKGITLFAIITIAIVVLIPVSAAFALKNSVLSIVMFVLFFLAVTSMIALIYRWGIDLAYDNEKIKMKEGGAVKNILIVSQEIFFTVITICIYMPVATVKIYRYYVENTEVRDNEENLVGTFGCDIDTGEMFLFIWGQVLLSIITAGIYTPWAMCKIYEQLISKTYLKTIEE